MKDIDILVVTHKKIKHLYINNCYSYITVGDCEEKYDYSDNVGHNITNKNNTYCELTATYWAWKNLSARIVGLCHYRRFFGYRKYPIDKEKNIISSKTINKVLRKKVAILPNYYPKPKRFKEDLTANGFKEGTYDFILMKVLKNKCPEYCNMYRKMKGLDYACGGNMLIAKKEYFDRYCEWLFPLLENVEKELYNNNLSTPRRIGYISEELANLYFLFNYGEGKIQRFTIVNTENYNYSRRYHIYDVLGIVKIKQNIIKLNCYLKLLKK